MPRMKKNRKSGGGRPCGQYSVLDKEERTGYHRKATNLSRGNIDESSDDDQGSAGRPPLFQQAMTPRTLRKRKRNCISQKRRATKTSKARQKSVNLRWETAQNQGEGSVENDFRPLEQSDEDCQPLKQSDEDCQPLEQSNTEHCQSLESEPTPDVAPELPRQTTDTGEPEHSERTLRRLKAMLTAKLPTKPLDQVDVFLTTLPYFGSIDISCETFKINGYLTKRQLDYRAKQIHGILAKYSGSVQKTMFRYWLNKLYSNRLIEHILDTIGLIIPEDLIPKTIKVSRIAAKLAETYLSRSRVTTEQKKHGISYVTTVAKEAALDSNLHGDIELLASATSCDWHFAKEVLVAIKNGNESNLLERNVRRDSIKATQWPELLSQFVFMPENTRAVPGQDAVSVRYGVRRPKYLLLKSKKDIAANFKATHPDCNFSISTIIREFPQNAVTPTTRDLERNTCPTHANARRILKCLHKNGVAKHVSSSCREMACLSMCRQDQVNPADPLTWEEKCVFGGCEKCPEVHIDVPPEHHGKTVHLSLWTYAMSQEKNKNIFGLHPQNKTVGEIVTLFIQMLPKLRKHIHIAHHQWHAHSTARSNLDDNSVISIEDYQQNLEVVYSEQPTSMAYSTNKQTVAVYPICVEFLDVNSSLTKGAVVFVSSDKGHDFQQVKRFEDRMFEILRDKCPHPITNWLRYSDGCASQFRSRKVNANLLSAPQDFNLQNVSFDYFEANEGKNISDSIGSIVKCAFQRGIAKSEQGLTTCKEIVEVIRAEVKPETAKFKFFIVEEFDSFE